MAMPSARQRVRVMGSVTPTGDTWFPRILLIAVFMLTIINAVRPMGLVSGAGAGGDTVRDRSPAGRLRRPFAPRGRSRGTVVDRTGEALFLVLGTALIGVSVLAMVWVESVTLLIVTQAILSLGHIINIIAAQTMIANRTRRDGRDRRYGHYAVAASVGQLLGAPIVAGAIAGSVAAASRDSVGQSTMPVFAVAVAVGVPAMLIALSLLVGAAR